MATTYTNNGVTVLPSITFDDTGTYALGLSSQGKVVLAGNLTTTPVEILTFDPSTNQLLAQGINGQAVQFIVPRYTSTTLPATNVKGSVAFATDTNNLYFNNGTSWIIGAFAVPVTVAEGGTGAISLTAHGILLGEGTSTVTPMAALAKGSLVVGQTAADPTALAVGTDGQILTADSVAVAGISYKTQPAGALEQGTWSDVTASRALTTIYQNTSGKKRRISVQGLDTTGGDHQLQLVVGSANPPTLVIANIRMNSSGTTPVVYTGYAEAPNSWYYQAKIPAGALTLNAWFELDE